MSARVPGLVVASVLLACATARADSEAPVTSASERGDGDGPWTHGSLRLRYVFRAAPADAGRPRETDQDLSQDLLAEGGAGTHLRYELSARVHEDIDGRPTISRFRDVYDTYHSWATAWLATAYVEALELGPLGRLRLGRQYLADGVEVRFDGGLVESAPLGGLARVIAYGGIPAPLWRSSVRGDWLAGGGVEVVAIPRTSLRFDYTHVTDYVDAEARRRFFDGVPFDRVRDDDRFQVTLVHRPIDELRLFARASTFDGRSTRAEAELTFLLREAGFQARARYVAQLGEYRDLSVFYDPFTAQIGVYRPYHELLGEVRQTLFDVLVLRAGGGLRKLFHASDEGAFNHELARAFGGFELVDWPAAGFSLAAGVEWYRSLASGRTLQATAEVSQAILETLRLGLGTQYAAFKLDEQFLVERQNARSYDAFLEWRPVRALRFRVAYDYETNDEDHFHRVRCDARFDF